MLTGSYHSTHSQHMEELERELQEDIANLETANTPPISQSTHSDSHFFPILATPLPPGGDLANQTEGYTAGKMQLIMQEKPLTVQQQNQHVAHKFFPTPVPMNKAFASKTYTPNPNLVQDAGQTMRDHYITPNMPAQNIQEPHKKSFLSPLPRVKIWTDDEKDSVTKAKKPVKKGSLEVGMGHRFEDHATESKSSPLKALSTNVKVSDSGAETSPKSPSVKSKQKSPQTSFSPLVQVSPSPHMHAYRLSLSQSPAQNPPTLDKENLSPYNTSLIGDSGLENLHSYTVDDLNITLSESLVQYEKLESKAGQLSSQMSSEHILRQLEVIQRKQEKLVKIQEKLQQQLTKQMKGGDAGQKQTKAAVDTKVVSAAKWGKALRVKQKSPRHLDKPKTASSVKKHVRAGKVCTKSTAVRHMNVTNNKESGDKGKGGNSAKEGADTRKKGEERDMESATKIEDRLQPPAVWQVVKNGQPLVVACTRPSDADTGKTAQECDCISKTKSPTTSTQAKMAETKTKAASLESVDFDPSPSKSAQNITGTNTSDKNANANCQCPNEQSTEPKPVAMTENWEPQGVSSTVAKQPDAASKFRGSSSQSAELSSLFVQVEKSVTPVVARVLQHSDQVLSPTTAVALNFSPSLRLAGTGQLMQGYSHKLHRFFPSSSVERLASLGSARRHSLIEPGLGVMECTHECSESMLSIDGCTPSPNIAPVAASAGHGSAGQSGQTFGVGMLSPRASPILQATNCSSDACKKHHSRSNASSRSLSPSMLLSVAPSPPQSTNRKNNCCLNDTPSTAKTPNSSLMAHFTPCPPGSLSLASNLSHNCNSTPTQRTSMVRKCAISAVAQQLYNALLDEEVALYTSRLHPIAAQMIGEGVTRARCDNPVATILTDGDDMVSRLLFLFNSLEIVWNYVQEL